MLGGEALERKKGVVDQVFLLKLTEGGVIHMERKKESVVALKDLKKVYDGVYRERLCKLVSGKYLISCVKNMRWLFSVCKDRNGDWRVLRGEKRNDIKVGDVGLVV